MTHVTVTIPIYNHGRFIQQTILSVLQQQWSDLDVLAIDDCSKDNSFAIASAQINDTRLHVMRNEQNIGLAGNWNRCLEFARGPLVMVFGSDDLLEPDYLMRVNEVFDRYPNVGLVYAPVKSVDSDDNLTSIEPLRGAALYKAGDQAVSTLLQRGICTATTVFRRECYERLGPYNEAIHDGPDIEFCVRIAATYDIYDLGTLGGSVRVHGGKWGHLSYLRPERLDNYMVGQRMIWSHLSSGGLRLMQVDNIDKFLATDGAQFAFNGALVCLANGRPDLARNYLRRSARLDREITRSSRYWQAWGLTYVPVLGKRILRKRLRLD